MFLDSKDKSLNMLNFCLVGLINEIERTKKEEREPPGCEIRLQCIKCTVWPRIVADFCVDF